MTDMLKSVVSQGIGSPAGISGVQAGGKTGTTSSEFDIWFDGFTPSYAGSAVDRKRREHAAHFHVRTGCSSVGKDYEPDSESEEGTL